MLRFLAQVLRNFSNMTTAERDMSFVKKIGTHSGCFHCDEALACFMLKQLPEYHDAEIIRSRENEALDTCDIVVDVGGVYNPKIHRYDHHQKTFTETISTVRPDLIKDKQIKLSSAGLIYAHFGLEVINAILEKREVSVTKEDLGLIYRDLYNGLIEEIDALDNGVPMFEEAKPAYSISTHIGSRVHRLNPEWNSTENVNLDEQFRKAVELVGTEFIDKLMRIATVWLPARNIVKKSIENRTSVHGSGQIVELVEHCPWKGHLLDLEKDLDIEDQLKFVIFQDRAANTWRIQGIPLEPDSFICRIFLHKDWQGVRDEELSKIAGIDGCVFCHATGFIGGNKSRQGAIEMALKSIKASEVTQNGE